MAKLKEKGTAKNVYIVIIHSKQMLDKKEQVMERCEFVDKLTMTHETSATVIIDYLDEKIIKNRDNEGTYKEFLWYLQKNYPQQMTELAEEYK